MTEQLNVSLALDVIYVHGTVNGVEADFTLTAPGVWTATVPRAEDGRYVVSITAYNSLGTPTVYETTIVKLDDLLPLKTDWVATDTYNADDLNRVEASTDYIAGRLAEAGYPATLGTIDTGRTIERIEFADMLNRVESNIDALHSAFVALPNYQEPKEWGAGMPFDYRDANRLERNLLLIYTWLNRTIDAFRYCGTFACGEGGEIY